MNHLQTVNIILDSYSALICLILIIYLWTNGKTNEESGLFFMLMCISDLGMLLGDIASWAFEGLVKPWYPFALRVGTALNFACTAPLLLTFIGYIMAYLSPKVTIRRYIWNAACALAATQFFFSVLSLWNGMFFYTDSDNLYQRGDWFWLSQLIPFLIYGIVTTLILRYRRYLRPRDMLFLLSYVVLPLIGEMIQIVNYGIALMGTAATASILLIFINIQSKRELLLKQQEKELVEARISILISQIQPHFLYNTLTAIRQLCDLDPKQAKQAIGDFALFLRANMNVLESKAPIPFSQELSHVQYYLNLERQRFRDRLRVIYDIGAKNFAIPPLTVQPLAENAVRHGIMRREEGGSITLRTEETDTAYRIVIIDDGVGFTFLPEPSKGEPRVGIRNVRRRLEELCGGSLQIESIPGTGTTAIIIIPKEGKSNEFFTC
ncbi:sensor histidine kinase [Paenibacillus flagellatus]|uniref:Transcriptional regulator n=1 Tax=Paenibacillus flagellatus TaxID=2211139 RepID=A0A2V5JV52_9BACL|nr:histidine kinase [Paenibacillus flagellatus]PYI49962.1 transcriptional regulator [Paenibacillus flagellatus]